MSTVVHVNGARDASDFESITVSNSAIGLTSTKLRSTAGIPNASDVVGAPAQEVFISVESQAVRFRLDGTDPTAAVGHALEAGATITITGPDNLRRLRFIRRDGSDATLRVTYYK